MTVLGAVCETKFVSFSYKVPATCSTVSVLFDPEYSCLALTIVADKLAGVRKSLGRVR